MLDERYVSELVASVISSMGKQQASTKQKGVFATMSDALEAVNKAYQQYRSYTI